MPRPGMATSCKAISWTTTSCWMATSAHPCHAQPHMHTHAVHCMLYIRINSDMPTVATAPKPVQQWHANSNVSRCPLPLMGNIDHWHFTEHINSDMPIFFYYILLNSLMLITRWHMNKKFKKTLLTHPQRKTFRLIPLWTPVNSHETLTLKGQ